MGAKGGTLQRAGRSIAHAHESWPNAAPLHRAQPGNLRIPHATWKQHGEPFRAPYGSVRAARGWSNLVAILSS